MEGPSMAPRVLARPPALMDKLLESWHKLQPFVGPAFLVAAGYMDPGNWATAIEGGARFGYNLVWVVTLSHLVAVMFQTLSAKLGLGTGMHLAQACRAEYPRPVCLLLWILCEISMVALDLTMLLGSAIGLNLLFKIPVLSGLLISSMDAFINLLVVPRLGVRRTELLAVGVIGVIVACFVVDIFVTQPPMYAVAGGMWPTLSNESLYTAVSLLGANVMPHNFFLHSALVIQQPKLLEKRMGTLGATSSSKYRYLKILYDYNFVDISCALGAALFVNIAVLIVAAAAFHKTGNVVTTLQGAHDVMEQLLSSNVAPAAFGLALLCAGQLSSFTGTIAGQFVLEGFLNYEMRPWLRRLITRLFALTPAVIMLQRYGNEGIYNILLHAQVVLAMELPFVIVPLIKVTSSKERMEKLKINAPTQIMAWACTALVFGANIALLFKIYWQPIDTATGTVWWWISGKASETVLEAASTGQDPLEFFFCMAKSHPVTMFVALAEVICISIALGVLLWMIVTPLPPVKSEFGTMEGSISLAQNEACPQIDASRKGKAGPVDEDAESSDDVAQGRGGEWEKSTGEARHRKHRVSEGTSGLHTGIVPESGMDEGCTPTALFPQRVQEPALLEPPSASQATPFTNNGAYNVDHARGKEVPERCEETVANGLLLSRGSRKQFAAHLDAFWSEIFDLHGRSMHTKEKGELSSMNAMPLLQTSMLQALINITKIPGSETLRISTCGLESDLRQDEDRINGILLSLTLLPPKADLSTFLDDAQSRGLGLTLESSVLLNLASWCLIRILELCVKEPRPELWGKYCFVLNRLQGSLVECIYDRNHPQHNEEEILSRCNAVTAMVLASKGPSGTGAGEIAFPKGKEITLSVMNRYTQILSRHQRRNPFMQAQDDIPNK